MRPAAISRCLLAGWLAGCATNPATGKTEISLVSESQEIALGDDADQLPAPIGHWKAAEVVIEHQLGRLDDRSAGRDGDDIPGHDLVRAHGNFLAKRL